MFDLCYAPELIPALKERLAQPEQEPVIDKSAAIRIATALGWEPRREWVGLTDDDLRQILLAAIGVAEAKLKEKNT